MTTLVYKAEIELKVSGEIDIGIEDYLDSDSWSEAKRGIEQAIESQVEEDCTPASYDSFWVDDTTIEWGCMESEWEALKKEDDETVVEEL